MNPFDLANRFEYHPTATRDDVLAHEAVRARCRQLAEWLSTTIPEGREQALAITHLEDVMFWANAGLARHRGEAA